MTASELEHLARTICEGIKTATAPLHARIVALESRTAAKGQRGTTAGGTSMTLEEEAADAIVAAVECRTSPLQQQISALQAEIVALAQKVEAKGITYHGTYEAGRRYVKGDAVTHSGSLWIAHDDTSQTPGSGPTRWQLAAKRGRDGRKDARNHDDAR